MKWTIRPAAGLPDRQVALVPDSNLHASGDGAEGSWKASGERACFLVALGELGKPLPGGWTGGRHSRIRRATKDSNR